MAATLTPKNPVLVKGKMEQLSILALDAKTWKAGQFGFSDSGKLDLCATDATAVQYFMLEDQDTATSSTTAKVGILTPDLVFEINELQTTLTSANVGECYGMSVAANLCTLDKAEVTAKAFRVIDIASNYEPEKNKVDDIKARCWVKVLEAVING